MNSEEEEEEEEELSYSTLARDKRRRPRSRHASHHGGNRSIENLWRHDNAKAFPTPKVCLFVAGFQTVDVDTKLLLLTPSPVIAHFRSRLASQYSKAALNTFSDGQTFLLDKANNILMGTVKVIYFFRLHS